MNKEKELLNQAYDIIANLAFYLEQHRQHLTLDDPWEDGECERTIKKAGSLIEKIDQVKEGKL